MSRAKSGDLVAVYADESCLGNGRDGDNPGGAGGLIEWLDPRSNEVTRCDYWISEPATTNNRMALRSVIEAFRALSRSGNSYRVVFTSDSKYIVKGMNEWLKKWKARGWKKKGGPILNLELWKEARLGDRLRMSIEWQWVARPRRPASERIREFPGHPSGSGTIKFRWVTAI